MRVMSLTTLRLVVAAAVASAGLVALTTTTASADDCDDRAASCGGSEVDQGAGTVQVRVWGTTVDAGSGGSSGSSISSTVAVDPPCHLAPIWTAEQYIKGVEDGSINGAGWDEWNHWEEWKPIPTKQLEGKKGWVYGPTCNGELSDKETTRFFLDYPTQFIEEGETPPTPPIPPRMLLEAAMDSLELPEPTISWNPKINGTNGTLVNLDTFAWLDDSPRSLELHAAAGPSEVTVNGEVTSMDLSAPTAEPVTCAGIGESYQAGMQDSECSLIFSRAMTPTPVTVTTNWGLDWTANGEPRGALDPMSQTGTTEIPVDEAQTVVEEVG